MKYEIGQRLGMLTILSIRAERIGARLVRLASCRCDCGVLKDIRVGCLANTRSCSCMKREWQRQRVTKHGAKRSGGYTSEYIAWSNIKARCLNPNAKAYVNYGARGIRICDEWASSFERFLADVGAKPSTEHSIDRVNNDGDYEPGNVRWTTRSVQAKNRRKQDRDEGGRYV